MGWGERGRLTAVRAGLYWDTRGWEGEGKPSGRGCGS